MDAYEQVGWTKGSHKNHGGMNAWGTLNDDVRTKFSPRPAFASEKQQKCGRTNHSRHKLPNLETCSDLVLVNILRNKKVGRRQHKFDRHSSRRNKLQPLLASVWSAARHLDGLRPLPCTTADQFGSQAERSRQVTLVNGWSLRHGSFKGRCGILAYLLTERINGPVEVLRFWVREAVGNQINAFASAAQSQLMAGRFVPVAICLLKPLHDWWGQRYVFSPQWDQRALVRMELTEYPQKKRKSEENYFDNGPST